MVTQTMRQPSGRALTITFKEPYMVEEEEFGEAVSHC